MNIGGGDDLLQSGVLSIKLWESRLAKDVVLSINVQRKSSKTSNINRSHGFQTKVLSLFNIIVFFYLFLPIICGCPFFTTII